MQLKAPSHVTSISSVDWSAFDELGVIGIDEIARLKGRQNFVAVIITMQSARDCTSQQADSHVSILAVLPNRQKDSVRQFLETIPARLRGSMHTACTDMWAGYVNAVKEFAAAHADVIARGCHRPLSCGEELSARRGQLAEKGMPAAQG